MPIKRGLEYVSAAALNLFVLAWIPGRSLGGILLTWCYAQSTAAVISGPVLEGK